MQARLQKFIAIGLLFAAVSWAVAWTLAGHPAWACAGALLILFGYALFLAVEFGLLWWIQQADGAPRPHLGQLLTAWCGEVVTAPRVFLWNYDRSRDQLVTLYNKAMASQWNSVT